MAKYKLKKPVAKATSFRYNGVKYVTRNVTQEQLKQLYKNGYRQVTELKEPKKPVNDGTKENDNAND